MSDILETIKEYSAQIEQDTHIDITNVMEKQLSSPNIKHKWLYKKVLEQKKLIDLIDKKDSFINNAVNKNDPTIRVSKAAIAANAANEPTYKELQRQIKDQELLVEFLDAAVNKIFTQMGWDFRNIVDLMKMEQL